MGGGGKLGRVLFVCFFDVYGSARLGFFFFCFVSLMTPHFFLLSTAVKLHFLFPLIYMVQPGRVLFFVNILSICFFFLQLVKLRCSCFFCGNKN